MGSERMSWSCLSRAVGVSAAGWELDGRAVVARWAVPGITPGSAAVPAKSKWTMEMSG